MEDRKVRGFLQLKRAGVFRDTWPKFLCEYDPDTKVLRGMEETGKMIMWEKVCHHAEATTGLKLRDERQHRFDVHTEAGEELCFAVSTKGEVEQWLDVFNLPLLLEEIEGGGGGGGEFGGGGGGSGASGADDDEEAARGHESSSSSSSSASPSRAALSSPQSLRRNTSTRVIEAQPYERFTRAQLSEFEEIFRLFDGDGDGAISREELKKALLRIEHGRHADDADEKGKRERFLGGGITDETVEAMMRSVDEDGSGRIELQEWFNMLALCFFGRGDDFEGGDSTDGDGGAGGAPGEHHHRVSTPEMALARAAREADLANAEVMQLLLRGMPTPASFGFPGSDGTLWSNWLYFVMNNHPLFSACFAHELHPFTRFERALVYVCSVIFSWILNRFFYRGFWNIAGSSEDCTTEDGCGAAW